MNTLFCKRLKKLRKENEKTQLDVSKYLKVNRSTYGAYESGKIMPPADKCKALADYYRVSLEYLLGYDNVRGHPPNPADVTDVSEIITDMLHQLENDGDAVAFEGETLSGEVREVLATSLGNTLRLAKLLKKGLK